MARRGNNEGTITKRKDGRWEAKLTLPDGHRKSFYAKTRHEVAQKLLKAQKALSDGIPMPSNRTTLGEYLATWLENTVKLTLRPYTYISYAANVRLHITPELGHIQLANLAPPDVQSFLNRKLESGLSARTVQYNHAILRSALGQAERWNLVTKNVARLVSPPRVIKREVSYLTFGEARKLTKAAENDRLGALYTVAMAVGLRQGEALGLRWQDVNLEAKTLTVKTTLQRIGGVPILAEPKTDKSRRTIKLPDVCVSALSAHRDRQAHEQSLLGAAWMDRWGLVFTEADGTPLARYSVTRRFQRLLDCIGIPKRRFHDLRHTCATLLLAQGVDLKVIQETLGHTLFSTTADIYSHVLPVLMADAANRMDAALTGS